MRLVLDALACHVDSKPHNNIYIVYFIANPTPGGWASYRGVFDPPWWDDISQGNTVDVDYTLDTGYASGKIYFVALMKRIGNSNNFFDQPNDPDLLYVGSQMSAVLNDPKNAGKSRSELEDLLFYRMEDSINARKGDDYMIDTPVKLYFQPGETTALRIFGLTAPAEFIEYVLSFKLIP